MTSDPETQAPESRNARLRILMPIALVVAGLVLFLALFWGHGHDRKGHGRHGASSAERERSPVGGSSGDEGNSRVTGGGSGSSPVGGGPSRSGSGGKGDTWWYHDGKTQRGKTEDAWWAPKQGGRKSEAGGGSPVGGSPDEERQPEAAREPAEKAKPRDKPAHASPMNPGEAAGQKGGPDDFWWRK